MAFLLLIARLVLAAVFAVAGLAKLADRSGSRASLEDFGLDGRAAVPLAFVLPFVELAAALLLLPTSTARWGGLLALALLVLFSLALAARLRRGEAPDCHCFGQLRAAPIGPGTLVRNGVLGALAAFVLLAGRRDAGPSAIAWVGDLSDAGVVAVAAGALIAVLAAGGALFALALLRRHGRLLLRVDALEAAAGAERTPDPLALEDLDGRRVRLDELPGRDTILLFWKPGCSFCAGLLEDVRRWEAEAPSPSGLVVVCTGDRREARGMELRAPVLLDPDFAAAPLFGVTGTPAAVGLGETGRVRGEVAVGADEVLALLEARRPSSVRA